MCSLDNHIVCREKEHDKRCAGRENVPVTHARLVPYFKKGKRWFYIRGVCEECLKHITDKSDIMTVAEAIYRRDLQREMNQNSARKIRATTNGRTEVSNF